MIVDSSVIVGGHILHFFRVILLLGTYFGHKRILLKLEDGKKLFESLFLLQGQNTPDVVENKGVDKAHVFHCSSESLP
jgi:hypothetical protein